MQGVISRVFRDHYPAYSQTRRMAVREEHAVRQLLSCRTSAQGYHVVRCEAGDYESARFNSCKHRSCPVCGSQEATRWVREQEARALPCPYHQMVFTLPEVLQPLWLYNRVAFSNLLFRSAWESLRSFTDDPRWLGATPGVTAVMQSWGETLNLHVHLHLLVTAGGLDAAGEWVAGKASFFCPARALSVKFRGRLRAALREAVETGALQLPPGTTPAFWRMQFNKTGRQKWAVYIAPAYAHPRGALRYLGAYLRRGPLGASRIKRYDGRDLTIAYKHPQEHPHPTFTLGGGEFVRRWLIHVPIKGQRVVRHFGLFHHRWRDRLETARAQLSSVPLASPPRPETAATPAIPHPSHRVCPYCGRRLNVVTVVYPARAPPERQVA